MHIACIFVLLLIVSEAAFRQNAKDDYEDWNESDADWETKACGAYNDCLQTYDERIAICGHAKEKEPDETDDCYEPIRKYFTLLVNRREKKNQLMRGCFESGKIEGMKRDKREKFDRTSMNKVGHPGGVIRSKLNVQRHRSSCRTKFAELEQFLRPRHKLGKHKKTSSQPLGSETCHAAAKRIKERCQKIENCCPRVKSCRQKVGQHPIVTHMRELEARIREERRVCKEQS